MHLLLWTKIFSQNQIQKDPEGTFSKNGGKTIVTDK